MNPEQVIRSFADMEILIIGDVMLDHYVFGIVERISPEAPVPILRVRSEKLVPGGAANVANNIKALGAKPVLCGVIGDDEQGTLLMDELAKAGIDTAGLVVAPERATTQKTRMIASSHQMLRVDREEDTSIAGTETEKTLIANIELFSRSADAIIISDYAKGAVTFAVCEEARKSKKKVIIDPKPSHKAFYKDAFLITPNAKEAEEMSGHKASDDAAVIVLGQGLSTELNCRTIITRGEKGMAIFDERNIHMLPTRARKVFDVSGAGDTAVAAITLAISSGATLSSAAEIGNAAAGLSVEKIGTSPVTQEELLEFIKSESNTNAED